VLGRDRCDEVGLSYGDIVINIRVLFTLFNISLTGPRVEGPPPAPLPP
jgi:hypothetical protein